ncbi:MAG: ABC transporter ATP-binding protein [Firmicutes bacterium]|jgi:oligopeptide/dipeptide ABC transporter ATP-binding protein|nr:ABC transporter ATP-binding protein [Bacillota bacterium]
MKGPLLEIRNLKVHFHTDAGVARAVDGVNLTIAPGEVMGLVGESGCGKSVTALSIMGLIRPPGKIVDGQILFQGKDLVSLPEQEMQRLRGGRIAMIFQDPLTTLNPVIRVGDQIIEAIAIHQGKEKAWEKAVRMLELVGISSPERRMMEYPHQLSGGMRQRVMIAIALSCHPALLIADEPTTALDVTIQAQILDLMARLQQELNMGILFITHDLGVVAEFCDRVAVMYAGKVVEVGDVRQVLTYPLHPYTRGLLKSIPRLQETRHRIEPIEGLVPELHLLPPGCSFHDRCPLADKRCAKWEPSLREAAPGRLVSCLMIP